MLWSIFVETESISYFHEYSTNFFGDWKKRHFKLILANPENFRSFQKLERTFRKITCTMSWPYIKFAIVRVGWGNLGRWGNLGIIWRLPNYITSVNSSLWVILMVKSTIPAQHLRMIWLSQSQCMWPWAEKCDLYWNGMNKPFKQKLPLRILPS